MDSILFISWVFIFKRHDKIFNFKGQRKSILLGSWFFVFVFFSGVGGYLLFKMFLCLRGQKGMRHFVCFLINYHIYIIFVTFPEIPSLNFLPRLCHKGLDVNSLQCVPSLVLQSSDLRPPTYYPDLLACLPAPRLARW